jgi:eukaryotic-like serine/threonine-protein kinase
MTRERWRQVEEIFHAALARVGDERQAFLIRACAGDLALRREVETLLAQQTSSNFLSSLAVAATTTGSDSGSSLMTGRRFAAYQVHERIGVGGMGEVYRARDTKLGRDVAIKILPRLFTSDPDRLARFEREARVLASLNHPHIGAIYGLEDVEGVRALVLELVDGKTLADRIAHGPMRVADALTIARQMADALDAAHEKGIIHRDLKPANIKVTPDGVVKVLDFGLARIVMASDVASDSRRPTITIEETHEGLVMGTAAYMSPEQARGQSVDKRTDIWAFGCVLYEMLTGRTAFARETMSDTIASVLDREPDWSALPAATPPSIHRLLGRCLRKDVKQRLHDVADARLEIDEAQSGATAPVGHAVRPRGARALAWSAAAMIAIAAGAFALGHTTRPEIASSGLPTFSRVVRLTASAAYEMAPALSPDGKWVAYLSDARGPTDVWVQFVGGGQPINLTANANLTLSSRSVVGGLEISPDSSRILFQAGPSAAAANATYSVPAPLGGVPSRFLESGSAGVRWSPDGRRIAYVRAGSSAGDAIWIADGDGNNARVLVRAEGNVHVHWPSWSADGHDVYFHRSITAWNAEPTEVYRVAADGGTPERVVASASRAAFAVATPDGRGLIYAANPTKAELNLWWRPLAGGEPVRLTTGVGEYAQPRISLDGRTMVCTLFETRNALLRVSLGSEPAIATSLTNGYGGDLDPDLSRSGDRIVFSSTRSGQRNLWIAHGDTTDARPLTSGESTDEYPQFAPDGRLIAFISNRGGQRGLWIVSIDGGVPRRILAAPVLPYFSWSPDGNEIVYATPVGELPGLSTVTVADGRTRRLPTRGGATSPAWSPKTGLIAYLEVTPNSPGIQAQAFVRFVTSSGDPVARDIGQTPPLVNGFLVWSPDGQAIAAVRVPGTAAASLWIADLEGNRPVRQVLELPKDALVRGITWAGDRRSVIVGLERASSDIVLFDQTPSAQEVVTK